MKQYCKWMAALFTVASATAAFAWTGSCSYGPFGASNCGYSSYQLAPVGERVVYYNNYNEPTPGQVLGNTIAAPFHLVGSAFSWTGRTLSGQPAVVGYNGLEPVGERFSTVRVIRYRTLAPVGERFITRSYYGGCNSCLPVGERVITRTYSGCSSCGSSFSCPMQQRIVRIHTMRQAPQLLPVGERFTTVRIIRQQPMLQPIGERFVTIRTIQHRTLLPVGEKFTTVKVFHHGKMLSPVGEKCKKLTTTKVIKHHGKKVMLHKTTFQCGKLQPIGERVMIRSQKVLLPIGERAWTSSTLNCGCR